MASIASSIDQILRNELTDEQYKAATDGRPEVLCLACAGSGKSRTLAYRIARLLAEEEQPESIVAFTFTDKAAESIKRRVSEALSKVGLDPTILGAMYIGTIHSYCQGVLGDIDTRYRQFEVLDENRLKLYMISRFYELGLSSFRSRAQSNSYFDTIRQMTDAWNTANDELLDFNEIESESPELGHFLKRFRIGLEESEFIDFSLMIRNVVVAIQDNVMGLDNGIASLRHLMVDEYQDVNPCQEELIRLLHSRSETLFVVGDDDQSIYAWRGADVKNIIEFQYRYPQCGLHTLTKNFRSTVPIVQATDTFVAKSLGPARIPKSPTANTNRSPQDLGVLWFLDRGSEAEWVASRIKALIGTAFNDNGSVRGLTPGDFAILMRSTRTMEQDDTPRHTAFTTALQENDIQYSLEAGGGPFERPQTSVLRSTFELFRHSPITRSDLEEHYNSQVLPAYPNADFNELVGVVSDWSRKIHQPEGSTRIRLYPQQLVYELLESFNVAGEDFDDSTMRDIGLFSRMIMDVETVYMSVDSRYRFEEILNFLHNAAETGYDVSTDDVLQRPDAVTVSTVHKMKGLEFPCIFVVDVESHRFPKRRSSYRGWLPERVISEAVNRGAYQSTHDEEIRLFYTATTRAERYLYVTGASQLPQAKRQAKPSKFALTLKEHPEVRDDPGVFPAALDRIAQRRRIEETDYPTNFTEIRYYLRCPKSYQFRERFGLNPVIPEMFGFGKTVHTSIQRLHALHPNSPPESDHIERIVSDTFHLKHVPQSNDPTNKPGAYEVAKDRAVEIAKDYVECYSSDFARERQVEATFEIPTSNCVISGSIDPTSS